LATTAGCWTSNILATRKSEKILGYTKILATKNSERILAKQEYIEVFLHKNLKKTS